MVRDAKCKLQNSNGIRDAYEFSEHIPASRIEKNPEFRLIAKIQFRMVSEFFQVALLTDPIGGSELL